MGDRAPRSATSVGTGAVGLCGLLLALLMIGPSGLNPEARIVVLMLAATVPMLVVDIVFHRVHRRPAAGLDWDAPRPIAWSRVLSKLIGLIGTLERSAFRLRHILRF